MERENRRNSVIFLFYFCRSIVPILILFIFHQILKPVGNQVNPPSMFEYADEDTTENFTSTRRKSLKRRVSFAEHNEIK